MDNWDNKQSEELFLAILNLKNLNEAKRFFRDLLTEKEILEFSRRWQVAQMLNKRLSYLVIQKKTGLSSTTIARIAKWLNQGKGGYKLALEKISNHHNPSPVGKGLS